MRTVVFHLHLPLATLQLIRVHSTFLDVLPTVETMPLIAKQIETTEKETEKYLVYDQQTNGELIQEIALCHVSIRMYNK